jgi:hypoxanthine phosphoribosyltransferase
MQSIVVNGKSFRKYLESSLIDETVAKIANQVNTDYNGKKPLFIAVLNGSFMFASDLFKKLNIECEISFVKLSSYAGTASSGNVQQLIGITESIEGRDIIIVEDIVDTGLTLGKLRKEIQALNPGSLKLMTLLFKPAAFGDTYPLDYVGLEIPNDFIVGYGLDYDGFGRNLPDIYAIES